MGIIRSILDKLGIKTYTIPGDLFLKQVKDISPATMKKVTATVSAYATATYMANTVNFIECFDIDNNTVELRNGPHVECKIYKKNGKTTIMYFDTLFVKNGILYGTNSRLVTAEFTKKSVPLNEIDRAELQALKKGIRYTSLNN